MDIKRILASAPRKREYEPLKPLVTPWGEKLFEKVAASEQDDVVPLPEHPRPQFARNRVTVLNGWWNYRIDSPTNAKTQWETTPIPTEYEGRILVPYSPESTLSHVERQVMSTDLLWYQRNFRVPALKENERCLLHFDAVDYACACYCNGVQVGKHLGGYMHFSFDITNALTEGTNEIALCVWDPSDTGTQLRGKQQLNHGGIWYTAQSGIWQTVWLEIVPVCHISAIELNPDCDTKTLEVVCELSGFSKSEKPDTLKVEIFDGLLTDETNCKPCIESSKISLSDKISITSCTLALPEIRLWSPEDPYLYGLRITYGNDIIESYCAFRKLEMKQDKTGVQRFYLNDKPCFLRGVLDQGYWPEGLLTAPSDEALVYDIEAMRSLGFNMLRKHIKIEHARWYYHCDKLGMLVWQDMVSGGGSYSAWHTSYKPTLFKASWGNYDDSTPNHYKNLSAGDANFRQEWLDTCIDTIKRLKNHPSIVTWVLFNEAWGQFEARKTTELVRSLDTTRPIDAVSGWYDQACGDFLSVHNYFRDLEVYEDKALRHSDKKRAFVISEFGGLTYHIPEHSSLQTSYGYENFSDLTEWQEALRKSLAQVDSLEAKGMAGFVYTQVSDIEEETNGILTYDRRINKLSD